MRIFFLIFLMPIFLFFGCTSKYERMLLNNIAEARQFMYTGENDGIKASFVCGCREEEYVANGIATPLKDFGVITFELPKDSQIDKSVAQFVLTIGANRYDGVLETNPFDGSLVADIGEIVNKEHNASAKLIAGEFVIDIKLNLISDDWNVEYLDVVDIVVGKYKKEIKSFIKDNLLCGEVYIKMINGSGDYCWYFNLISTDGNSLSLVISKDNGEILASNYKDINKS